MTSPRFVAIALALGLVACTRPQQQEHIDAAPAPPPTAAGPVNPDPKIASYTCADGEMVQVGYPDRNTAVLDYKGRAYTLKIARSASGARYIGYGLQWWTTGPDAGAIATLKAGEEIASAPGVRCTTRAVTPVSPPEPGTPGGLPDDRTPVSEAPFTPTSAQGAADVVQTYYALIGEGKYAEAARLRADGQAFDASRYAQYGAQVGAPGAIGGAAGSLYVEVPVVIYGRLKSGAELHQSGKAVLRRVNDVPGSTPEQRRWRIERIDLKP
jgi:membrane-bound inhibitor of C-type lysozyme